MESSRGCSQRFTIPHSAMLLRSSEIESAIASGQIVIAPFDPRLLRRASYTLRLAGRWARWQKDEEPIRMWSEEAAKRNLGQTEQSPAIVLRQGDFVLGSSLERISVSASLAAIVCTLSHIARFGLSATSGSLLVRPGFGIGSPAALTFELTSVNPSPLEICEGTPICHLGFIRLSGQATCDSKSLYETIAAPSPPMLYEDFADVIGSLPNRDERQLGTPRS